MLTQQQRMRYLGRYAVFYERFFGQPARGIYPQIRGAKPVKQIQKIAEEVNTQEPLLRVNSVFPLMLFPDSLVIDRQKVIITHRDFFAKAQIVNIQINDLQSIEADVGPFLGSLSITTRQYSNTVHEIHMLSRSDALNAQSVLQGFVIAKQRKLDYSHIEKNQLVEMLKKLGRGEDV